MASISFFILIVFVAFVAGQDDKIQSVKKEISLMLTKSTETEKDNQIMKIITNLSEVHPYPTTSIASQSVLELFSLGSLV